MNTGNFVNRHNGPSDSDVEYMLNSLGLNSVDQLIDQTIPVDIRLKDELNIGEGLSEYDARIQVMQDFENVEKRARLAGYL